MSIFFKSFIFNVLFFIWLALCSIVAFILGIFIGYKAINRTAMYCAWGMEILMHKVIGITCEIRGKENIPSDLLESGKYLVACKHQSLWETLYLHRIIKDPVIILKKELMYIPIFGQILKIAGSISIDRARGKKVIFQMIQGAQKSLEKGRPVFIFPEGTRSLPGGRGVYRPGIGALYDSLKVPVIPIAVNSGYFWPRRGFLKRPGKLVAHILRPIMPGLEVKEFMKTLEDTIEGAAAKLPSLREETRNKT